MRSANHFFDMKAAGRKIAMLTAYDAPTARAEAAAGVDLILVGDSVGTNILGYASEKDVTIADIAHHVRAVRRGAPNAYVIGDLPYRTCDTPADAIANSRILVNAGGHAAGTVSPWQCRSGWIWYCRSRWRAGRTAGGWSCR